jgi:hypothetical protein
MRTTISHPALLVIVGCDALHGCSGSPMEPSPAANSLHISGPTLVTTGETVQYRAMAVLAGGSSEDVTDKAVWDPSGSLTMTSPGRALAALMGPGQLRATYTYTLYGSTRQTRDAELRVLVLDPGTFWMKGSITRLGGVGASSRIDVLEGTGKGRFAFGPSYTLLGVAGQVRLQASSSGYVSQVHDVLVTGNGMEHDFVLEPLEQPDDVAGLWTMTLSPSPGCFAGLPDIAARRSYAVQLDQSHGSLKLKISSPTLRVTDESLLFGNVTGALVRLQFRDVFDESTEQSSPNVVDQISPTETLSFAGTATGTRTGTVIPATMAGTLSYWRGKVDDTPDWQCRADDHSLRLDDRR